MEGLFKMETMADLLSGDKRDENGYDGFAEMARQEKREKERHKFIVQQLQERDDEIIRLKEEVTRLTSELSRRML